MSWSATQTLTLDQNISNPFSLGHQMSIWSDKKSKYGSYQGKKGSPKQWAESFQSVWEKSNTINSILTNEAANILGIPPGSNEKTIKKAYYKLAKKYHTDKNKHTIDKWHKISKAYQLLMRKNPNESI